MNCFTLPTSQTNPVFQAFPTLLMKRSNCNVTPELPSSDFQGKWIAPHAHIWLQSTNIATTFILSGFRTGLHKTVGNATGLCIQLLCYVLKGNTNG